MILRYTISFLLSICGLVASVGVQAQEVAPYLLNEPPRQLPLVEDSIHLPAPPPPKALSDPWNRTAIVADYNQNFLGSAVSDGELGWTGSLATCTPGTNSTLAQSRTIQRINYYRRLVGLPDNVTFDASRTAATQAAALMMGANNSLNHNPPANWLCYSPLGATGAANSNLAVGSHSSQTVKQYMDDNGSFNTAVGHRRWLLYSRAASFGSGNTLAQNPIYGFANALWVFNPEVTPAYLPNYVAFPPVGYVPRSLIPPRWSFGIPGANFASATITVRDAQGTALAITKHAVDNGYGDNTVVWDLTNPGTALTWNGSADKSFAVTVSGVVLNGVAQPPYNYTVVAIDPTAVCPGPAPAAACSVVASGGLSQFYGVESVNFNTLSDRSSSALDDGNNYLNLSCAMQTTVTSGSSYTLSVKGYYTNTHRLRAWIDFNGNGTLTDAGEQVINTSANSASVVVTIPQTAPANTPLRLRIQADSPSNSVNNPCTLTGGGQITDYAILVQGPACTTFETVKNGSWNDPATWSCGQVPGATDAVLVKHTITIGNGQTMVTRNIRYQAGASILLGAGARLRLGQ